MSDLTLENLFVLLSANFVDFEVEHGKNTAGTVRTSVLAKFHDKNIRLDFGDPKHGKRLSRLHVDGDHKQVITMPEFFRLTEDHRVNSQWRSTSRSK